MKILRAYKTELDPNHAQQAMMRQCVGAARYVFNWGLAEWKRQYEAEEKPSEYSLRKLFNSKKDEQCPWIRELPYAVVESAFANLGAAFQNFFRRVKQGEKPGYPRFKKRGFSSSFQVKGAKITDNAARLTNIGWVRLKERGYIPVSAERYGTYATVSLRAGRWYLSVLVEAELPEPEPATGPVIGVDVGIKSLAVLSDGTEYENPKSYYRAERTLKRLQRELARRTKGGRNYQKTKDKVGKAYAKVSNIRAHTLHQISHEVTHQSPRAVVMEDLNVRGMLQNGHLAKAISDASFGELRRQMGYKASWRGIEFVLANQWEPSSKTCSRCGHIKQDLTLADRIYRCDVCGLEIDRDRNAAINLAAIYERRNTAGLPGELAILSLATVNQEAGTE